MTMWAILPVKPLKLGKTRLAEVLSEDERYVLNTTLLGNTLSALRQADKVDQVLVISRDPGVLSVSRNFGVRTLQEDTPSNLNRAVTIGVRFAVSAAADRVMILPADIPLINTDLVQDLAGRLTKENQMIIVPDRRDDGTNSLLLSPPSRMQFQFGLGSFRRHIALAKMLGLNVDVVRIPELGLDLDLPEDLEVFKTFNLSRLMNEMKETL